MPTITVGTVVVTIPDGIEVPAKAGKMTEDEVRATAKPRRGVGLACDQAATAMEKSPGFSVPGLTAADLRRGGTMAEEIDKVIEDLGVVLVTLKQANLLLDAAAYEGLRKVNDQVKAQGKFDASLLERFTAVTEYFKHPTRRPTDTTSTPT